MNDLRKNLYKVTSFCGLLIVSFLHNANGEINAQGVCETNPDSLSSSCYVTPETYKARIYEMGLCTSDPLAGTYIEGGDVVTNNTIDESTCTSTFESQSGSLVDISPGAVQTLTGENITPPPGTYPHAYIKLSNTLGLKGKQKVNDVTYYSSSDGTATTNIANYVEWDEKLIDFEKGPECEPLAENRVMGATETFTSGITGTMKAVLSHLSGGKYVGTTQADCGDSTRIFGSFAPTNPIVITSKTKGLQVTFTITDKGLSVIGGSTAGKVGRFSSGPFTPAFETF